ncbi:MAG: hypothetical protein ACI865_002036 [Flavobacteriaceae bacterium]|jgi:hypothetical protein
MGKSMDILNFEGFINTKILSKDLVDGVGCFEFSNQPPDSAKNPQLPEKLMLGKRAERYFSLLIDLSDQYEMVLENIQVFEKSRTIGEFDFIVRRLNDNQLVHIELVYKFYLLDKQTASNDMADWVGPNRNDSLKLKVEKLSTGQFPLLKTEEAKNRLLDAHLNTSEIIQELAFYANLFVPIHDPFSTHTLDDDAVEGYWGRFSDIAKLDSSGDKYFIPNKFDWFLRSAPDVNWMTLEEASVDIKSQLNDSRSPMLWKLTKEGKFERLFVVWW